MTYPDERLQGWFRENLVACKLPIAPEKELAKRYGTTWTPGLLWLDAAGVAHHSNVGFFEPVELIAEAALGAGHVFAADGAWDRALALYQSVGSSWGHTAAAPAAKYWEGVAAKKSTGRSELLMQAWNELLTIHPDSSWASKVSFIET